jgi:hypothetical protein
MKKHFCIVAGLVLLILNLALLQAQSIAQPELQSQSDLEILVPPGTVIPVALSSYLNSKNTQVGDTFYADTLYPLWIQQRLVVPKGSTIRGTVTAVKRPGFIRGKGQLAIRIDDVLLPNGIKRNLVAAFKGIHGPGEEKLDRKSETVEASGAQTADIGQVVATTGNGAIIGAIVGGGKGAALGGAAAAGLGMVIFSRSRDLVLDPGTQFDLELQQPLRFSLSEIDFTTAQIEGAQRAPAPGVRNQRELNRVPAGRTGGLGWPW